MKQVCDKLNITYETLRYYCDEGVIPNIKRDNNNYRSFDDRNIEWIKSLLCLKQCGMSLAHMKKYMNLCLVGISTVTDRKKILTLQKIFLEKKIAELQGSIRYIDSKNQYFDDVLSGKIPYSSNIIDTK